MLRKFPALNNTSIQVTDGKKTVSVGKDFYILAEDNMILAVAETQDELLAEITDSFYFGRITKIIPVSHIQDLSIEKGFR